MTKPNAGSTAVILDKAIPWLMENNKTFKNAVEDRLLEVLFAEKSGGISTRKEPPQATLEPV
jgi:hypothetical protein